MTLDQIEKLARDHIGNKTPPMVSCCDIARALLLVLPVVRAAERYHATMSGPYGSGDQCTREDYEEHDEAVRGVVLSIDTMRRQMEGKDNG